MIVLETDAPYFIPKESLHKHTESSKQYKKMLFKKDLISYDLIVK